MNKRIKTHGNLTSHRYGCRCAPCVKAYNDYQRKWILSKDPSEEGFPHGTLSGYTYGCRCDMCRKVKADSRKVPENDLKRGIDPSSPNFPHGTFAVAARCKCELCLEGQRRYSREKTAERMNNPEHAEKAKGYKANYKKSPRGKLLNREHQRRRTICLSKRADNLELVKKIYLACPDGYTVDHIKAVANGGSHTPDNLQYLPGRINQAKGCRDNYDCSEHIIRWQDILGESSTTRA